ncbi:MAG: sugar phosphate isomerase/epimerase family protein [Thermodesulfobacteriota bacterium]
MILALAARVRGLEEAGQCLILGFKTMEITLPCPAGQAEEDRYRELALHHGLSYLAHGPEEGDPRDLEHLEKEYLPRVERAVQAAAGLGCLGLTIHFWLEPRWLKPEVIDRKIKLLSEAASWGRRWGVPVNLENLSESWAALEPVMSSIPDLGLTLDLGHAQLLRKENASLDIIEHFFDRIRHIHLHDNQGGDSPRDDLHLPPGQGAVPFQAIFTELKKRGYRGTATLELKPSQLVEARDWVAKVWAGS